MKRESSARKMKLVTLSEKEIKKLAALFPNSVRSGQTRPQAALFIDGGHLTEIWKSYGKPKMDFDKLAKWSCPNSHDLGARYFYDAQTWDRNYLSTQERFWEAVRNAGFTIRQGTVRFRGQDANGKPQHEQKRVDSLITLDITDSIRDTPTDLIILLAGDEDFVPVVQWVQQHGKQVYLIHAPGGIPKAVCDDDLKRNVNSAKELGKADVISKLLLPRR